MGCFWSSEARERCLQCRLRAVNNLVIIDGVCEVCISRARQKESISALRLNRFYYGKYRCQCGRVWDSRRSWANKYQVCSRCKRRVYAHAQRELMPSDITASSKSEDTPEHPKELCEMCQQLGYYCGKFGRSENRSAPKVKSYSKRRKSLY